jgi:hypothetical protein
MFYVLRAYGTLQQSKRHVYKAHVGIIWRSEMSRPPRLTFAKHQFRKVSSFQILLMDFTKINSISGWSATRLSRMTMEVNFTF